ncbi:MAG: serine/threonine-protein kinase [Gemmatimonadaceae bacterium]
MTTPATISTYTIIEPIGSGGMGAVFKAHDPVLNRHVAIKVLPPAALRDPQFTERFHQEAQIVAQLEHANIIPVYGYGVDGSTPWMAMRLVSGASLARRMADRSINREQFLAILRAVASGLDYAHAKGVVHRDVKPQNILLEDTGHVYLADFGIAKVLETTRGLTSTGTALGTPEYMSPEQAQGRPVDGRSDIYALAVLAYEFLVGRVPFTADSPLAVLMKHVAEEPQIPPEAPLNTATREVLLKGLAKNPGKRWESAGALVLALDQSLPVGVPPTQTALVVPLSKRVAIRPFKWISSHLGRRPISRRWRAIGALATLTVGVGSAWRFAPLSVRCRLGQASACTDLGQWYSYRGPKAALDPSTAVRYFRLACDRGDATGCYDLGRVYETGEGLDSAEPTKARQLLQKACDMGSGTACFMRALHFQTWGHQLGTDYSGEHDDAEALRLHRRACDLGIPIACQSLAEMYTKGWGVTKDDNVARQYLQRALSATLTECEKGEPEGDYNCVSLADAYARGLGTERDHKAALKWYRKGCSSGGSARGCLGLGILTRDRDETVRAFALGCGSVATSETGGACYNLAAIYAGGTFGQAKDVNRAAALYKKACDAKSVDACNDLGVLYSEGARVPKDRPGALVLFEKACDLGNPRCEGIECEEGDGLGCVNAARDLHSGGDGITPNEEKSKNYLKRAIVAFDRACAQLDATAPFNPGDADNARACWRLAQLTSDGDGLPKDVTKAATLLGRACAGGVSGGCFDLGFAYLNGHGVAKDNPSAARFLQNACDLDATHCGEFASMLASGSAFQKDMVRAVSLYERGCEGGGGDACNGLGVHLYRGEGVTQDIPRALTLYQKACTAGAAVACFNLGEHYELAASPRDPKRATSFYRQGCEGGYRFACLNLGFMYKSGVVTPPDSATVEGLLDKVCGGLSPAECGGRGEYYEREEFWKDFERAALLYRWGCEGKDPASCTALTRLRRAGISATPSRQRASDAKPN